MVAHNIKKKMVHISIPDPAYEEIKKLATDTARTVPGYIRFLIHQDLISKGLPIYISR